MKDIMQIGKAVNGRERAAKAARKPRSRAQYRRVLHASGDLHWVVVLHGEVVNSDFPTKKAAIEWATDPMNADIVGKGRRA